MNPQQTDGQLALEKQNRPGSLAAPESRVTAPRPSLWPLLGILLLAALALSVLIPPPRTNTEYSSGGRSLVSRVRGEQRSMTIALETYYLDHNAYPAWGRGADGVNAFAPPQSPAWQVPTFRARRDPNDALATLTTPISYISSYYSDPFADVRGATFAYWTPPPDKGTGYIIWSPGPDGAYDLVPEEDYAPAFMVPSPSLLSRTYDPSNGASSRGDVYRYKQ